MRRFAEVEASARCEQHLLSPPLKGPSNPTVTAVNRTEAIVSWEPPDQFAPAQLKRYEVYTNSSSKPIYSGTQTFCHLRGLRADCQYHFKVIMGLAAPNLHNALNSTPSLQSQILTVPKRATDMGKTSLNSKRGTPGVGQDGHHGKKFQPLSNSHKKRRQDPDKSHVNRKNHSMEVSLVGTTAMRLTRSGTRLRPHRTAPTAPCNSPVRSSHHPSPRLDGVATRQTVSDISTAELRSPKTNQPERLLFRTQRRQSKLCGDALGANSTHHWSQLLCKRERNSIKRNVRKVTEVGKMITVTRDNDRTAKLMLPLLQGGRYYSHPGIAMFLLTNLPLMTREPTFRPFQLPDSIRTPEPGDAYPCPIH